jgi:hypothetical protein
MNDKRNMWVIAASLFLTAGALATAGLPKLPKLPGTGSAAAPAAAGASTEGLVQRYVQASTSVNTALRELALAYGLKEHAAKLDAEIAALQSGAVSNKDSLKKNSQVSSEAQAAVQERMDKGEALSEEGKKHYAAAWEPYILGVKTARTLPDEANNFRSAAKAQMDSASPVEKAQVMSKLSAGTWLAGEVPGFVSRATTGFGQLLSYAQKNNIPVPNDATSVL